MVISAESFFNRNGAVSAMIRALNLSKFSKSSLFWVLYLVRRKGWLIC